MSRIVFAVSSILAFVEFFVGTKAQAKELGTSWMMEIREELRFAFKCRGNVKVGNTIEL